jgi:hypothetical protein
MKHRPILAVLPFFLLASCASKLSEAQKSSLTQVMVNRPVVEASDLKPADGTDSPNAATTVPIATGGGLIPALIGTAIDAGVTAHQANEFKKQYGAQLDQVQAQIPRNPGPDLRDRAAKVLKKDEFFGSRLVESGAPNRFDGDLVSYGLVRYDRSEDQTVLGMKITCNVWLTDAKSKKLFTRTLTAMSEDSHTIHDYAAKPSLVKKVYAQALDGFEVQFKSLIDAQLNR